MAHQNSYRCYAHGCDGSWEAICVDLDIAIQGSSFDEVRNLLNGAVASYVADAVKEAPEVREQLLARKAPWYVTTYLNARLVLESFARGREKVMQATFPVYASPQMHFSAVPGYN